MSILKSASFIRDFITCNSFFGRFESYVTISFSSTPYFMSLSFASFTRIFVGNIRCTKPRFLSVMYFERVSPKVVFPIPVGAMSSKELLRKNLVAHISCRVDKSIPSVSLKLSLKFVMCFLRAHTALNCSILR